MRKHIGWVLSLGVLLNSCDVNNELPEIKGPEEAEKVALQVANLDFSKYIAECPDVSFWLYLIWETNLTRPM